MRCLNSNELVTRKIATICKMQKILQHQGTYNPQVSKFMYKYTKSHLPAKFNNYFYLTTDVHPYSTSRAGASHSSALGEIHFQRPLIDC